MYAAGAFVEGEAVMIWGGDLYSRADIEAE